MFVSAAVAALASVVALTMLGGVKMKKRLKRRKAVRVAPNGLSIVLPEAA